MTNHKTNSGVLFNLDCLDFMPSIPDKSIDMILCDLPYGSVSQNGELRAKYKGQKRNIDKSVADIIDFNLNKFLIECERICKGSIYTFCSIEQLNEIHYFYKYIHKNNWIARHCIWHKKNPSPFNGEYYYLNSFENIVFSKRRQTVFKGHCLHNIFNTISGKSLLHPTQKPVSLFEEFIQLSTNEGDVILDSCSGSGTTAIASINTNRKYICIEKDKGYYDLSVNRINHRLEYGTDTYKKPKINNIKEI